MLQGEIKCNALVFQLILQFKVLRSISAESHLPRQLQHVQAKLFHFRAPAPHRHVLEGFALSAYVPVYVTPVQSPEPDAGSIEISRKPGQGLPQDSSALFSTAGLPATAALRYFCNRNIPGRQGIMKKKTTRLDLMCQKGL